MGTPLLRIKDENGVWHDIEAIRGLSAYQLAVKNGYEGTEEQWLASITGVEGKSAYQVAQAEGYDGTEEQWLASLKGAKGDQGKSAYQVAQDGGYTGTEAEWLNSLKAAGLNDVVKNYIDGRTTPTAVSLTILASAWGETVTIEDEAITATKNVVMIPGSTITKDQLNALQKANCQDCGVQGAGSVTFKVFGTIPTIDIPVKLIIGGNA
jgi:hypothetical protein